MANVKTEKYEILVSAVDNATAEMSRIGKAIKTQAGSMGGSFLKAQVAVEAFKLAIRGVIKVAQQIGRVIVGGMKQVIKFTKSAIGYTADYEVAMKTLNIIAGRFGVNQDEAGKAAKRLG